ncbi:MAG: bifunctional 2-C-methyl-D-erythritol 4-phosphate cytidylyltransferase/2-C-methyl-D-erythritol 2,4-cyclodiphosphate synthase [Alphaproteobacteria bacterium]|nr:bifunctional 2-C-methyl-D-erythritol 4-phosphate cytidylyltransferase/2-C-methyl-D-erythritol 2,4-cyclodiphosphate synthase [Alphaproteobacteria bacterium]
MATVAALVVAAGRGKRMPGEIPKQYRSLAGRPILTHSLAALRNHPQVSAALAVIHPDDLKLYEAATAGLDLLPPVLGGPSRQDSVREGLERLSLLPGVDRVLIHDGVRPLLPVAVIDRVLAALDKTPGAIAGLQVVDTLKRTDGGLITATVSRDGMWRAQTPQGFHLEAILMAHRKSAGRELTDDAAVAEAAGLEVAIVAGDARALKITTESDLRRAERLLAGATETRIGSGFDVHRFGPGDHVMLCGIRVPHGQGLIGHSDADVALHAATDALLGAIGDGDIGQHYPPGDPRWKGAASARFLADAVERLRARGGRLLNLDVTLICEEPRIGPHRDRMRAQVAEILGVAIERINIKATTTEKLGFTGRGEGVAAQAVASVALPAADGA